MAELSLSNALLDGIILTHTIHPDDDDDDIHELTEPEYPALVYSDPYKALNQTILFKPPSKKPTKTVFDTDQSVTSSPPRRVVHGIEKKKSWDNVITDFISKKKKSPLHVSVKKTGTLSRSRSWDTLHKIKDEEETADGQIETFVYKPQMRKRSRFKKEHSPQRDSPSPQMEVPSDDRKSSKYVHNSEEFQNFDDHPIVSQLQTSVPPRQLVDEEAGLYEVPVSIHKQQEKPSKPPRTKRMSAPVEPKKSDDRRFSFTSQDVATPQTNKLEEMNSKYLDGELGLLKIKVLAVHIPQKPVARKVSDVGYDSDDDEMLMKPVIKVTPKDGLYCALSINGEHSRYESSVQPLNPIQQASFWDQTEMEPIFILHTLNNSL